MSIDQKIFLLRHFVATLGYRGRNILAALPSDIADFRSQDSARTPGEILKHINDVLGHAESVLTNREMRSVSYEGWTAGVECFFVLLRELDKSIDSGAADKGQLAEKLLQGPFADVMLHLGQIGILRRMAGSPIEPEMYFDSPITAGEIPNLA